MKRKNSSRKEKTTMDDKRVFGYCENCGEEVNGNYDEYYIADDGKVFCSVECVCEAYCITKVEV
jgi:hypothetical protein